MVLDGMTTGEAALIVREALMAPAHGADVQDVRHHAEAVETVAAGFMAKALGALCTPVATPVLAFRRSSP
jgi:hypothetical protein